MQSSEVEMPRWVVNCCKLCWICRFPSDWCCQLPTRTLTMQLIKKKFKSFERSIVKKCLNWLLVRKLAALVTNAVNSRHAVRGHQAPNRFIMKTRSLEGILLNQFSFRAIEESKHFWQHSIWPNHTFLLVTQSDGLSFAEPKAFICLLPTNWENYEFFYILPYIRNYFSWRFFLLETESFQLSPRECQRAPFSFFYLWDSQALCRETFHLENCFYHRDKAT